MSILDEVKKARRVSVPLIAINTPDPAATIRDVCGVIDAAVPIVEWDFCRGFTDRNEAGAAFVAGLGETEDTKNNPYAALMAADKLPAVMVGPEGRQRREGGVLFIHLAPRWLTEAPVVQAIWLLRDKFKVDGRTLVLLGKQFTLPSELSDDVVCFDEPLPDADALKTIIRKSCEAAGLTISEEDEARAVEALRGLSAFSAEQITAMSLQKSGIDIDALWERKRQTIEQTPGLKVFKDEGGGFESIGGCEVVKGFLSRILNGAAAPSAVVFVDEIEKSLGGSKGDLTGVTQDQLGVLLSYMQDTRAVGMLFLGPPGAAKSAIAKATGDEGRIPTIKLDTGATKGGIVGKSEEQIRTALKVITAVSNGKSLWIATCNSLADLPPELRRRFKLGTFFFDLPTPEERWAIWGIMLPKFEIQASRSEIPNDDGWTGAEIEQCCEIAWRLKCSLIEASKFVVPVSKSAADAVLKLREQANGRFLSASYPGVYRMNRLTETQNVAAIGNGRNITLD